MREEKEEKKTHIPLSSSKPQSTFILSFNIVFSKWPYIIISAITAAIFWITSSIFDQLLFFSPLVIFYLPEDAILGFILANITAVLLGIVVSMNIYVIRNFKQKIDAVSLFSGSSIGVLSSTCASCSSLGFFLISALGATGVTASAFLSNYQMPLRLLSIALLIWAYYTISIKLTKSCVTNYKNDMKQ